MAGGADMYFNGVGMSHDPMDKTVIFQWVGTSFSNAGPPLTCKLVSLFAFRPLLNYFV